MSPQQDSLVMQDVFQVTGYSQKPFYKLTKEEAQSLGAKENKDLIFFKGVLIRGNSVTTKRAIVDMDWIKRKADLWPGKPITILHPDFKNNVQMNGRPETDVIQDLFKYQEDFAVGRIMKVGPNPTDSNLMDFYGYLDHQDLVKGVMNGTVRLPRFGSPYIWALGEVNENSFDEQGNFLVKDHMPVHWSFVPKPAMGPTVEVKALCTGEEMACLTQMQGFADDTEYQMTEPNVKCPCTLIQENFSNDQQIDKSFYLVDPLKTLIKMSENSQESKPLVNDKQEDAKNFMKAGKKDASMPPTNNPDGEQGPVNPGEQADRDKAAASKDGEQNKKPEDEDQESPEEKNKLESMIEEVRAKATKSAEKKYEKTISEKDGEISKLQKEINELRFKEKEDIINETYPDGLFGKKEEDVKKAKDTRDFYIKLAKEKNLTTEELSTILGRPEVKTLNVTMAGTRGQANNADGFTNTTTTKEEVKEYMLGGSGTVKANSTKNKPGEAVNKEAVKNFFKL